MEELPPIGKEPEISLRKLNHLIKGQLRFLLTPDDAQYPPPNTNNLEANRNSSSDNNITSSAMNNHGIHQVNNLTKSHTNSNSSQPPASTNTGGINHFNNDRNARKNGYYQEQQTRQRNSKNTQQMNNGNNDGGRGGKSEKSRSHNPSQVYKRKTDVESELWSILEYFITDFILALLLPIMIIPLCLLNFLIRYIINSYYRIRHKGRIQLMRGEDAFWASESPSNPGNFTSMYVIEGECDLAKIRQRLSNSWVEKRDEMGRPMFDKLKLKAVKRLGYFAWEKHDSFDVNEHIRYFHDDSPERAIGEDELFEDIRDIYDIILPGQRPQWEILIVPNYIYNDAKLSRRKHYAIIFRIHHSIMDGLSAAQALRMIVADSVVEAGIDPMKPIKAPWYQVVMTYILALFLTGPYLLRHNYAPKESSCFHGPELTGPKTLGWSRPLKLEALKKIKESTRTSITAVFISCIGGAFRNLSISKGQPVPRKMTAVTCAAMIPYPDIRPQNRFCVLFTPIAAKEAEAFERLKIAQKAFDNKMIAAAEVVMAYWITWMGGCFPEFVCFWLQEGICHGTVLLSNLPGPRETTMIFGGDKIVDIVGWSPIRNRIGIALCLFGYNGRLRANVLADSSVFPDEKDVSTLITEFEKEFLQLGRSLGLMEQDCFTEEVSGSRKQMIISAEDKYSVSEMIHLG